jgi:anti-sigma regulatory factor (Ser/Thr protein kinase)
MSSPVTRIYEIPSLDLAREGWRLELLQELYDAGKLDRTGLLRLELAVQEAVTNSLEHGNLGLKSEWKEEFDRDGSDRFTKEKYERLRDPFYALRRVKITVQVSEESLDITIQDEGEGFQLSNTAQSLGLESYGRGLVMIRSNMDEVSFEDSGRIIKMKKNLVGNHGFKI